MPNYFLSDSQSFLEQQYAPHEFKVSNGGALKRVEGRVREYNYLWGGTQATPPPSTLQIVRNYQGAAAKIGGKVVYADDWRAAIQIVKNGKETWVDVWPYNGGWGYKLIVVDREAMQQDVVANAEAFRSGLRESGHVEVPGIYFDFGKSIVKPESEPALKEVVKLLQSNPALKVWVVGHTDYVGSVDANLKLSAERAAAVVRALTERMGIDPKRLSPFGAGPYMPVAPNETEAGRAKNRRVELVTRP